MNILLLVTTMVMVLAMLTYARIETYRSFSVMRSQFNRFMEKTERGFINDMADWRFHHFRAEKREPLPEKSTKSAARSRLSLMLFLNPTKRKEHQTEYTQLTALAKKLIYQLYKDQPFFREMEQKRPDFVSALLSRLELASQLPEKLKIQKVEDLGILNLQDEDLNVVFTKMLKGTAEPEKPKKSKEPQNNDTPKEPGEDEDPQQEKGKKHDYHSPEGYFSLLDYVTIQNATKIRVYLAPKRILAAIFDDPAVVKEVIQARNNYFKQATKDKADAKGLETAFEATFKPRSDPSFSEILDFSITKTNPKHYD